MKCQDAQSPLSTLIGGKYSKWIECLRNNITKDNLFWLRHIKKRKKEQHSKESQCAQLENQLLKE